MNDVQKLQLELLLKLDEVCKRHHLRYYVAAGTAIGAVRHKGFIPWDHDIDVFMPIRDARELEKYQAEFGDDYLVSSYRTDPEFTQTNMALTDLRHKCVVKKEGFEDHVVRLAMDIYTFYRAPKNRVRFVTMVWLSHVYKILVGGIPKNHGKGAKIIGKTVLTLIPEKKREKTIHKIEKTLDYKGKSNGYAIYFGEDVTLTDSILYDKAWFAEPKPILFEGHMVMGPTDPHAYLTRRYGDYMTPLPESKRKKEASMELIEE